MPSAGDTIRALDFPATAIAEQSTDETGFTSTTYTAGSAVCGVAFVAPTSGKVRVAWAARFETNTLNVRVTVSFEMLTGSSVGSGTSVLAASDSRALESTSDDASAGNNARQQAGTFYDVTGLTAGNSYNVRTMHRMSSAGNGDIFDRQISVTPLP